MFVGSRCLCCAREGDAICERCGAGLVGAGTVEPPPGLASCVALLSYEGSGRELVRAFKYRNGRALAPRAGRALAAVLDGTGVAARVDLVTWAPTTLDRRRGRGYDQAREVARSLARHLHLPVAACLRRVPGPPQTGRSRAERLTGPTFVTAHAAVAGRRILLVDDVLTTGATLAAAAAELARGGADAVHGAVVAHTPGPGDHPSQIDLENRRSDPR